MLAWMLYVVVVTALLSAAAYAAEQSAQIRRAPTRWLWGMSIIASLAVPTVMASVSIQIPSLSGALDHAASPELIPLRQITSSALAPSVWLFAATGRASTAPGLDGWLIGAWRVVSAGLILAVLANGAHLHRRKRRWERGELGGTSVYIADDVGPAVVGLLRPRIVMPRWLLSASPAEQAMIVAHEQSHLDANDAQLLTIAILLIVTMPWNLPLWWLLRRLRFAIEVDCDARVLKRGHDVCRYGAALIMVGERQSNTLAVVAAMAESKSFLEQRIRKMLSKRKRFAWISATALAGLGFALVAGAAEVSPPNTTPDAAGVHQQVAVDPKVLDGYVGFYRLGQGMVFTVTRDGAQLSAQLTGQPSEPIFAQSPTQFFYKVVDAQVTFITDAQGQATSLVLHQSGHTIPMTRISAAEAQQIKARTAARMASQAQSPGSEAALRHLVDDIIAGRIDDGRMSPVLAQALRQQLPTLRSYMSGMGAIQAVQFLGVDAQGQDVYDVRQDHGVSHWNIALDAQGKTVSALVRPGP